MRRAALSKCSLALRSCPGLPRRVQKVPIGQVRINAVLERRFNSSLATSERLSHQRDDGEIFAEPGPSRSVLDTVGSEGNVEQEPRVVEVEGGSSEAEVLESGSEATAAIEREVEVEENGDHGGKPDKVKKKPAMLSLGEAKKLIPTMADLNLHPGDKVTMACSGGVDSSVALRILSDFPINLNVVFMRNWDSLLSENQPGDEPSTGGTLGPDGKKLPQDKMSRLSLAYRDIKTKAQTAPCSWKKDWEDVQAVCKQIGIPDDKVKLVDLTKEYWERVFEPALDIWESGGTPNPDVTCNREIKFGALMSHIPAGRRSFLATGHYARVKRSPHATLLVRAKDLTKDQSYYLSSITEEQLEKSIFPLAKITKAEVKRLAEFYGLTTAVQRSESMGMCFVGERGNFGDFITQYMPKQEVQGYMVDSDGNKLKEHAGLWHFTEGQNAGIPGQPQAMYVAAKGVGESGKDILVVPGSDHPKLLCSRVETHDFNWIHHKVPKGIVPGGKKRAFIQVRHRMEPVSAVVSHNWDGKGLTMDFATPIHGVAPGQVVTMWYNIQVMGSAIIKKRFTVDEVPCFGWDKAGESRKLSPEAVLVPGESIFASAGDDIDNDFAIERGDRPKASIAPHLFRRDVPPVKIPKPLSEEEKKALSLRARRMQEAEAARKQRIRDERAHAAATNWEESRSLVLTKDNRHKFPPTTFRGMAQAKRDAAGIPREQWGTTRSKPIWQKDDGERKGGYGLSARDGGRGGSWADPPSRPMENRASGDGSMGSERYTRREDVGERNWAEGRRMGEDGDRAAGGRSSWGSRGDARVERRGGGSGFGIGGGSGGGSRRGGFGLAK